MSRSPWSLAWFAVGAAAFAALVVAPAALAASSDPYAARPYAAVVAAMMSVLFLGAFFDPKRPFRMLHFDLAALLAFLIPDALDRAGFDRFPLLSTPLLVYLVARALWIGFRPTPAPGPLLPLISTRTLTVLLFALLGVRIALNLDGGVIDVGYASVIGADRVSHGQSIYEGDFPLLERPGYVTPHGDAYGPLAYYAYVPFEAVFPWTGHWDSLWAAHVAAITFDLLTVAGLFMLGRTLWPTLGRELGVALAFAWVAYPYSLLILVYSTNNGLVTASLVWALVLARTPVGSGAVLALGAAAKFVAGAAAPLFATATGRRPRDVLAFAAVFIGTFALFAIPLLPDGGVREFWDRTVGSQTEQSGGTIWEAIPAIDGLRWLAEGAAIALGVVVAIVPRRRSLVQVAALGAAVIIALELGHTFWSFLYISWWAPFFLVAVLARLETNAAVLIEARNE